MGKQRVNILIFITALFAAFTLGFYMGRNYNHTPVQISNLNYALDSASVETTAPELLIDATEAEITTPPASEPVVEAATEAMVDTAAEPATEPVQTEAPGSSGLVNINTASASLLETLPGIGGVLAQRIVDYRNTYGPFQSVYALTNVEGIGEKRLAAILNLITV